MVWQELQYQSVHYRLVIVCCLIRRRHLDIYSMVKDATNNNNKYSYGYINMKTILAITIFFVESKIV